MKSLNKNSDSSAIPYISSCNDEREPQSHSALHLVDIGINLTNKAFSKNWKDVVRRAVNAGVHRILLTGTSIESSRKCLKLARLWYQTETCGVPNLFVTVGVHPHEANSWCEESSSQMRDLLEDPFAVAVGECGLDYNRNFSSKSEQIRAFREQLELAHELNYPIFLHEREAHSDLVKVLDEVWPSGKNNSHEGSLPKTVVHCFTGTKEEASIYIERGYYLGFTGTICKKERGRLLRKLLPSLPLDRLMVETDAPYMGFKTRQKKPGRKRSSCRSEPADCVDVAKQLSESIHRPFEEVCKATTNTAVDFFRLNQVNLDGIW